MEYVSRLARIVEKQCGAAPSTCPWRATESPLVQDLMTLSAKRKAGIELPQMSARLEDAFAFYTGALRSAQSAREELERKRREQNSKGGR